MKKSTLLIALFIIAMISANAQNKNFKLWLNAGFGPRILNTDPGVITTNFVDDSPSRDRLQSEVEVKDQYNRLGLNVELGYAHPFNLSHSVIVDVAFGKAGTTLFGYSLGYNQKIKIGEESKVIIRPALFGMVGYTNFKLGKIHNNAGFIQIGNDTYFDNELNVSLTQNAFVFGPQLNLFYIFPNEIGISCTLSYDFLYENGNPEVSFWTSNNNNQNNRQSRVNLDNDNLAITYNNKQIKKLPYQYGGLRLSLAISFYGEY